MASYARHAIHMDRIVTALESGMGHTIIRRSLSLPGCRTDGRTWLVARSQLVHTTGALTCPGVLSTEYTEY